MTHHSTVALPGNPDMSQYKLDKITNEYVRRRLIIIGQTEWRTLRTCSFVVRVRTINNFQIP
jgi:hypothetical protein